MHEQLHSNEHQQFKNGRTEKLVDLIGRKIRGMLLQLQMPPEFWGAAVVLATADIYNCTPHRSLGMESPHYSRLYKQPDLSFFRAFGCATVVHRGRDLVPKNFLLVESWACIWVSAPATVVAPSLYTVPILLGYMPLLTPDLMRHTFLFTQQIRECMYGQDYTPSIQLEQQSQITCRIRQWPASSRDSKALPFHVALHGTSIIFYSCPCHRGAATAGS